MSYYSTNGNKAFHESLAWVYSPEDDDKHTPKIKSIKEITSIIHREIPNKSKEHICFNQNKSYQLIKCPECRQKRLFENFESLTNHILQKHNQSKPEQKRKMQIFAVLEKIVIAIENNQSLAKIRKIDSFGVIV